MFRYGPDLVIGGRGGDKEEKMSRMAPWFLGQIPKIGSSRVEAIWKER